MSSTITYLGDSWFVMQKTLATLADDDYDGAWFVELVTDQDPEVWISGYIAEVTDEELRLRVAHPDDPALDQNETTVRISSIMKLVIP